LVAANAVLLHSSDEVLACFGVLLCLQSLVLDSSLPVLLAFFIVPSLACNRREDSRCAQNLVEMLELLTSTLLVAVCHWSFVDLDHVGKAVDYECAQQDGIGYFVLFNGQAHQACQGLEFGYLDEAVDVVVLEEKTFELRKPLELVDVGRTDDVVETDVLKRNLFHCLLEIRIIEHF
jgi:hypothetical protein